MPKKSNNLLMEERIYEKFLKERMNLKQDELTLKKGTYQDEKIQRKVYAQIKTQPLSWIEIVMYILLTLLNPFSLFIKIGMFVSILLLRKTIPYLFYYFEYNTIRYHLLIEQIEKRQIMLQKQLQLTKNFIKQTQ